MWFPTLSLLGTPHFTSNPLRSIAPGKDESVLSGVSKFINDSKAINKIRIEREDSIWEIITLGHNLGNYFNLKKS